LCFTRDTQALLCAIELLWTKRTCRGRLPRGGQKWPRKVGGWVRSQGWWSGSSSKSTCLSKPQCRHKTKPNQRKIKEESGGRWWSLLSLRRVWSHSPGLDWCVTQVAAAQGPQGFPSQLTSPCRASTSPHGLKKGTTFGTEPCAWCLSWGQSIHWTQGPRCYYSWTCLGSAQPMPGRTHTPPVTEDGGEPCFSRHTSCPATCSVLTAGRLTPPHLGASAPQALNNDWHKVTLMSGWG
jgi:hypothetical protein